MRMSIIIRCLAGHYSPNMFLKKKKLNTQSCNGLENVVSFVCLMVSFGKLSSRFLQLDIMTRTNFNLRFGHGAYCLRIAGSKLYQIRSGKIL